MLLEHKEFDLALIGGGIAGLGTLFQLAELFAANIPSGIMLRPKILLLDGSKYLPKCSAHGLAVSALRGARADSKIFKGYCFNQHLFSTKSPPGVSGTTLFYLKEKKRSPVGPAVPSELSAIMRDHRFSPSFNERVYGFEKGLHFDFQAFQPWLLQQIRRQFELTVSEKVITSLELKNLRAKNVCLSEGAYAQLFDHESPPGKIVTGTFLECDMEGPESVPSFVLESEEIKIQYDGIQKKLFLGVDNIEQADKGKIDFYFSPSKLQALHGHALELGPILPWSIPPFERFKAVQGHRFKLKKGLPQGLCWKDKESKKNYFYLNGLYKNGFSLWPEMGMEMALEIKKALDTQGL